MAGFLTIWFITPVGKNVNEPVLKLKALRFLNYTAKQGLISVALLCSKRPTQMTSLLVLTQLPWSQHSSFFIPNIVLHTLSLFKAKTFTPST